MLSIAAGLGLNACVTQPKHTGSEQFEKRYAGFTYSSLEAVRQSKQKSCGAAALTSVLNYWKDESAPAYTEKGLLSQYPSESEDGYPILQLRQIALKEGFAAFAVTMDTDPWKQLGDHLDNGRPVLCAVRLPRGKYFGSTLPLVETIDRQTVWSTGEEWKSHYVVAMGRSYHEILLMDPKYGIVRLSRDRFLYYWGLEKQAALICSSL